MKCLYCDCTESKVIDSRSADDRTIRRRRECVGCGRRFTTYETIEVTPVLVVKNNGTRQAFNGQTPCFRCNGLERELFAVSKLYFGGSII